MIRIKINNRQVKLMELLKSKHQFMTSNELSSLLKVSSRTVHQDLLTIEPLLENDGFKIVRKRGVGVKIVQSDSKIMIESKDDSNRPIDRRIKILQMLLFENQTLTYEHLSEYFFVSKTSIINDLKILKRDLIDGTHMVIESDKDGTKLKGKELNFRKLHLSANSYLMKHLMIQDSEEERLALLRKYYGENIVNVVFKVFYEYLKTHRNTLTDHYLINLLNVLIIQMYRVKNNRYLSDEDVSNIDPYKIEKYQVDAYDILSVISKRLELEINEIEIRYFANALMINKYQIQNNPSDYHALIDRLIELVGDAMSANFKEDSRLAEQLNNHVPLMIDRLQQGMNIDNPFIENIKTDLAVTFNVLWVIMKDFEQEFNITFDESEIGFLTIYFQSALERIKTSKKILVICPTGMATSELLVNRIKNVLPYYDSVHVASLKEIDLLNLNEYAMVLTTVKTDIRHQNVMQVSPLLNEQDVENILTFSNQYFITNHSDQLEFNNLAKFISEDTLFWNEDIKSREELLQDIHYKLLKLNIVNVNFIDSVLNREKMGSTDLPSGVAIPHGNPSHVNETRIIVIRNKHMFKWQDYLVKFIFIICIAEKDLKETKNILSDIYQLIEKKETVDQLYLLENKTKFLNYIGCDENE
ncbi:BglG family transcription antiterminator [Macrococcus animalis]|uniref:BglG family transcription antiterminator n=1 Tax=Macrococcus animalis TaxID=3395467 RepID=UPI0039BE6AF0